MSTSTQIHLINTPQGASWQQDNLVQIVNDNLYVLVKDDAQFPLRLIQKAARKIETMGVKVAALTGNWSEEAQWAFALGFTCVGKLTAVEFCGDDKLVNKLKAKLAVYAWSRDLTNQTPAELYPEKLAELASAYLTELGGKFITTKVISDKALIEQGWMGIYNVGKGSVNKPCLLEVDFNPTNDSNTPVAACLVGKGITFDSGGYSMKQSAGMFDMKCDMGGAAVTAGALALAIQQGLNKRVKLFLCCAENMVSSFAYKLGDIITYKNGVRVEVANTDAEGRLVLADGLMAAGETGTELIIDAATLTGAAVLATGGDYTALFGLDDIAIEKAKTASTKMNEPIWQLPLASWHQDKCPSAFADTMNSRLVKGGGAGGASNAAGFLTRFVPNSGAGWLHFDLSAAYNGTANELWGAGATGLGIATIAELLNSK